MSRGESPDRAWKAAAEGRCAGRGPL